jgi:small subunit ribosomal protein S6
MRRYETFVIIDPDITQEQREPVLERVRELMTQQDGFLVFEDVWGERKLAYAIKKKERGYYIRFDYCGLAPLVNEIERFFRIDDRVLKYMTIVLDKDVDLEKVKEEKAAAESQRQPEPAPQQTPEEPESALQQTPEEPESAPQQTPEEPESAPQQTPEEPESTPQQTPEEPESAELDQEQVAEKQEAKVEQEPQVEEEAKASDTTEPAETTTPVEKKEEA